MDAIKHIEYLLVKKAVIVISKDSINEKQMNNVIENLSYYLDIWIIINPVNNPVIPYKVKIFPVSTLTWIYKYFI